MGKHSETPEERARREGFSAGYRVAINDFQNDLMARKEDNHTRVKRAQSLLAANLNPNLSDRELLLNHLREALPAPYCNQLAPDDPWIYILDVPENLLCSIQDKAYVLAHEFLDPLGIEIEPMHLEAVSPGQSKNHFAKHLAQLKSALNTP